MAKAITQQTFDDVVKENIVEFSMSTKEAKEETIKQFEAQGINLANIIKDLTINEATGEPALYEAIVYLQSNANEIEDTKKLLEQLAVLDDECKQSIAHRVAAAKNGAHAVLIKLMQLALKESNNEILLGCLKAMNSLTNQQPDIFDANALAMTVQLLCVGKNDDAIVCQTLQWLQKLCIMHEMNRQRIIKAEIVNQLAPLLSKQTNEQVLRDVMALFRFLVLDDDIREEFSSAHEHARQIASVAIVDLTKLLAEFSDTTVLADLLLTIGALAVRQEFCTTVESTDGLTLIFSIMTSNPKAARLNREALKLIRVLAGNDSIKAHMMQQSVAAIIKSVLETHTANENVVAAALACISTLTLRVKENSMAFFQIGIADVVVEVVRQHRDHKTVQRNAAWAIRNMVSRSREQCDTWLSLGIEDLLKEANAKFPNLEHDIKAALRDLGCDVQLREEWTGSAEKKIINA